MKESCQMFILLVLMLFRLPPVLSSVILKTRTKISNDTQVFPCNVVENIGGCDSQITLPGTSTNDSNHNACPPCHDSSLISNSFIIHFDNQSHQLHFKWNNDLVMHYKIQFSKFKDKTYKSYSSLLCLLVTPNNTIKSNEKVLYEVMTSQLPNETIKVEITSVYSNNTSHVFTAHFRHYNRSTGIIKDEHAWPSLPYVQLSCDRKFLVKLTYPRLNPAHFDKYELSLYKYVVLNGKSEFDQQTITDNKIDVNRDSLLLSYSTEEEEAYLIAIEPREKFCGNGDNTLCHNCHCSSTTLRYLVPPQRTGCVTTRSPINSNTVQSPFTTTSTSVITPPTSLPPNTVSRSPVLTGRSTDNKVDKPGRNPKIIWLPIALLLALIVLVIMSLIATILKRRRSPRQQRPAQNGDDATSQTSSHSDRSIFKWFLKRFRRDEDNELYLIINCIGPGTDLYADHYCQQQERNVVEA